MEVLDPDTAAGHKQDIGPDHLRILSVERKFRALKIGAYVCQFMSTKSSRMFLVSYCRRA
jgi:hypothetical protein